ncbi:MAG TPA: hypothetical protein VGK84_02750, partial [Candidatus Tumulicola sp.]
MNGPLSPLRQERGGVGRAESTSATRPAAKSPEDDLTPDQQSQIAAQHAAFNFQAAEDAELQREHDLLQALLMEELKNEDEIVKKW